MTFDDPLDALYTQALLAKASEPPKRRHGPPQPRDLAEGHYRRLFTNPENWELKRHIAIFHEPSDSLVGNFAEYLHKSVKGCRRLVRVEAPHSIDATEWVTGPGWLGEREFAAQDETGEDEHEVILDLRLAEMALFAPKVLATALVRGGAILRLELVEPTRFWSKDGRTQLEITARTNILEVLDLETRIELRKWVGL